MIRRVRTPEGARFYGAPIGTPIVADKTGKVRALFKSSDLIGGNDPKIVKQKIEHVKSNRLPKKRPPVKWHRLGMVDSGPRHRPVMVLAREGSDVPEVVSEFDFNDEVFQGIFDDLQTVEDSLPEDFQGNPIGVYIPDGDKLFLDDDGRPDLFVGAYTVAGAAVINLNPLVAVNTPMRAEDGWDWSHHPPFFDYLSPRLSTMMHESGHLVSMARGTCLPEEEFPVVLAASEAKEELEGYALDAPQEAYAEMYAQYKMGRKGSFPLAEKWAERFGWD